MLKGNSNSFVTVDVSRGFVGIPLCIPIIHGILIYLSIYGLPLIWLIKMKKDEDQLNTLKCLALINNSFVLSIVLQRYHLFIWTVFTPKLFYLFAQTFIFLVLVLLKMSNLSRHIRIVSVLDGYERKGETGQILSLDEKLSSSMVTLQHMTPRNFQLILSQPIDSSDHDPNSA